MPQTWLMADTHLGHRVAARARGFGEDVQAHDATILRNLARKVRDGDDLYLLGDLAFDGWVERMPALAQLPGNLHIILGNHDRPAPNNPRGHHYQRTLMEASRALSVLPYAQINYKGAKFLLSHYPYNGDHVAGEERYTQWRLLDLGLPIIHGHTHSSEKLSFSALGTPQVCVSAEAWDLQPANLHQIKELIS